MCEQENLNMLFKTGFKPFQSHSSQFVFVRHVQAPDQNAKYFFFFFFTWVLYFKQVYFAGVPIVNLKAAQ